MTKQVKVLIVDDEMDYCDMIAAMLENDFQCATAYSGQEALDMLHSFEPQVVVTDVNMPVMSGFELCQAIKKSPEKNTIAVFMVSGMDTIEAKLDAFNAGADDFIGKPFEFNELIHKVSRTADYILQRKTLSSAEIQSRELAMASMKDASQYGYVMQFFKNLSYCTNEREMAAVFMEAMDFFDLRATLMLDSGTPLFFDKTHDQISPIEQNMYELLRGQGRLYDFYPRLMVNDAHVSFLVKNVPQNDAQKGKVRDIVAILVEGLEAKLLDISRQQVLSTVLQEIRDTLQSVSQGMAAHNQQVEGVFNDMLTEIAASFHQLDLTEEQEEFFAKLIEQGGNKMGSMNASLLDVKTQLEQSLSKLEQIHSKSELTDSQGNNKTASTVELF